MNLLELDIYLADLKNQTDNVRLLLESMEADLSQRRERMELTETTRVWLAVLGQRRDLLAADYSFVGNLTNGNLS